MKNKITINHLYNLKAGGEKIIALTAYDATMARLLELAGVEIILVGDSLGMVVQGHENTLDVTLEQMIYHSSLVRRGAPKPFLVTDLPFGSFQEFSPEKAISSAIRLIKEGRAESVKIEGMTPHIISIVEHLTKHGIPVMGHVGLTPQSVHAFGGFKIQGKEKDHSERLLNGAKMLESAGAHAIVLEGMPSSLATTITDELSIPTIGIGAGPGCDGQILVINDLLGMDERFNPSFVKKYADLSTIIKDSVSQYVTEVKTDIFPEK